MSETVENMKRMQAIARGDYMSYNQLFQCYYQPLCQYVYSLLEDKDDAEDVVQELFLKLWKDRGKIVITESASSYLYRMAKNMSLREFDISTSLLNMSMSQPEHVLQHKEARKYR